MKQTTPPSQAQHSTPAPAEHQANIEAILGGQVEQEQDSERAEITTLWGAGKAQRRFWKLRHSNRRWG